MLRIRHSATDGLLLLVAMLLTVLLGLIGLRLHSPGWCTAFQVAACFTAALVVVLLIGISTSIIFPVPERSAADGAPAAASPSTAPFDLAILVLAWVHVAWCLPRLLRLCFCLEDHVERLSVGGPGIRPLPSQQKVLDSIHAYLKAADRSISTTFALEGAWGTGKTTIIDLLMSSFQSQRGTGASATKDGTEVVVVHFDAWSHQAEPDLECALLRAIMRQWAIQWPLGWLRLPLVIPGLSALARTAKLTFRIGSVDALLDARVPEVRWRRELERLVRRLPARKRLVVVVDEVDRCAPLVAQKLMTLVRRFLAVPGIIVVLPYVRQQLQYKVFNPMVAEMPDLTGTIEAVVWSYLLRDTSPETRHELAQSVGASLSHSTDDRPVMRPAIAKAFVRASRSNQAKMEKLFEEKFVSYVPVPLPVLGMEDIACIVCNLAETRAALLRFVADSPLAGELAGKTAPTLEAMRQQAPATRLLADAVRTMWRRMTDTEAPNPDFTTVRSVKGSVIRALEETGSRSHHSERLTEALMAIHLGLRDSFLQVEKEAS